MARAFAPPNVGFAADLHARLIEQRLTASGEYVQHLPVSGVGQFVVMNYQYIPQEASINPDFQVSGTNPVLWGLAEHFEVLPKNYTGGNPNSSVNKETGSQFEIRGLIFNVKKVDANHRGSLYIELSQDDRCAEPRADFYDDVARASECP